MPSLKFLHETNDNALTIMGKGSFDDLLEGEVVSLKPKLKAKKETDQKPDFKNAQINISRDGGFSDDSYSLVVSLPVSKDFVTDKKRGPGEFVHALHDHLGKRFDNWFGQPTIGGLGDRAKNGMINLKARFALSAMDAYAYGLDLETGRSQVVKNKSEYNKRLEFAQKAVKELQDFKTDARTQMEKEGISKEEMERVWKENYMSDFVKLSNAYKDKGISYVKLAMKR